MAGRNKSVSEDSVVASSSASSSISGGWAACWKQRTLPEKLLFSVILVILVGFIVSMIVLVEIYLRLEDRLLAVGNGSSIRAQQLITDDHHHHNSIVANLTANQVIELLYRGSGCC